MGMKPRKQPTPPNPGTSYELGDCLRNEETGATALVVGIDLISHKYHLVPVGREFTISNATVTINFDDTTWEKSNETR